MPKGLNPADINKFARIGAAVKLAELEREIAALRRAFPGLSASAATASTAKAPSAVTARLAVPSKQARRGRKHPMTAAERRAVSERMKRYWAERNKSKG